MDHAPRPTERTTALIRESEDLGAKIDDGNASDQERARFNAIRRVLEIEERDGPLPLFYDRKQSAAFLTENGFPTSPKFLQKLATVGGGPPYQIFGNRALSAPLNLLEWAWLRLSPLRSSTSDAA